MESHEFLSPEPTSDDQSNVDALRERVGQHGFMDLTAEEVASLVAAGDIPAHELKDITGENEIVRDTDHA